MNLSDQVLAGYLQYGLPVLFLVVLVSAIGIPLPDGLLLIVAGSFVRGDQTSAVGPLLVASVAATLGDQIGFLAGRAGGPSIARRWPARVQQAQSSMSGTAVFLSRWLITALGPWINVAAGMSGLSWRLFFPLCAVGDTIWAAYNLAFGYAFSTQVQAVGEIITNLGWLALLIAAAVVLLWRLVR